MEERHSFFRSFRPAWAGVLYALRTERNFQIEVVVAGIVTICLLTLPLSVFERAILVLTIGFVLSLELVNTTFERLLDMLRPEISPEVKIIKDLVAGAVLVSAGAAALVGLIIFSPYFL
jgi:undecaprenol kinase